MRSVRSAVYIGLGLLWLTGCGRPGHAHSPPPPSPRVLAPQPSVTQASSPARTPAGTLAPTQQPSAHVAAVTPTPSPTIAPSATPSPAAAAKATPRVVLVAPDAAPRILAVNVSETTVHSGDKVSGSVFTTSNVASVEARVGTYSMNLNRVGVGRFALTYTVAPLPWFIHGTFTMFVIAKNTRGAIAQRTIPLSVR
ncbi:MAG TPA: hypothetical protein VGI19_11585 [Candidatus Cybelea sp.]